jgi:DNA polymerase-3 subunit alpha
MQLAQKLAGYSLGEADLMRRAMGKKKREEMARHEQKFVSGAVERGIKKEKAEQIFSLMAQFADYGFNRSHSVAYAYLAFQTAYLKAHFAEHFYAAVLSNEIQDTAKVFKYSNELRGQGIKLLPPDVNESGGGFTPLEGAIRYGLAAIKGIGHSSVNAIIEARQGGLFHSFFDFTGRVAPGAINKRVLESLVCAGAFDSLNNNHATIHHWRARLHHSIDQALARGNRAQRNKMSGQNDLFGSATAGSEKPQEPLLEATPWTHTELLIAEKNAVGFYITGHPLENYAQVLFELKAIKTLYLNTCEGGSHVNIGGLVSSLQTKTTKKGQRFGLLRLEDEASGVKCVVWPETFRKFEKLLNNDAAIMVSGKLDLSDDGSLTIIAEEIISLDDILQRKSRAVILRIPSKEESGGLLEELFVLMDKHKGDCEVLLEFALEGQVLVRARPHNALRVQGSLELESALRQLGCQVEWLNVTLNH